ncbi:MAG: caspase family protein [Elusimicrobia bacterium]|nr:caspase family protein [Elusimicrobiota bacterium]
MRQRALAAALSLLCPALAGCGPLIVNVAYRPEGPAQPVLFGRRPTLFLAPVSAATDGKVETYQGPFTAAQPAAQTLQEALTTEFGRLQYPLAETAEQAQGVVEAVVARMAVDLTGSQGLSDLVQAEYSFDLTVKDSRHRAVIAKRITGTAKGVRPGVGIPGALYSGMLTTAIGQAMGKLGPYLESQDLLALLEGRMPQRKAVAAEAPAPIRVRSQGKSKVPTVTLIQQEAPDEPEAAVETPAALPAAAPAAPRSDVDELPPARPARAKAHAVIIGIERYRESLPKADFAAGDARLMAEYARRLLGYPEENVALLTDDHATRGDFEKYFERWLPNRVEPGDDVLVYYSGHGAPNPKTGDAFLVPFDGDPTYIDQTGYPLKKLYAQLARLPAGRVTVVMDSCFSGAGGRSVLAKGARPLVNVQQSAPPGKLTVLSASAGDQISNSYDEKRHGLFTYFLLKGLKQSGDLRQAFDYSKPMVSRTARRQFNSDQDPQLREGR